MTKNPVNENHSDVARLLAQIEAEYESARQHKFITKRMERISDLHTELHNLVGDESIPLISDYLDKMNGLVSNPPILFN